MLWYNIMYFIFYHLDKEGVCYDSYVIFDLFPLR